MEIIFAIVGIIVGVIAGVLVARSVGAQSVKNTAAETERMMQDAREKAEILQREKLLEAKDEITKMREKAEAEHSARLDKAREQEKSLNARERSLDKRSDSLDSREHRLSSMQGQVEKRERDLERDQRALDDLKRDYEDRLDEAEELKEQINVRLEQVSGMTADEAKEELLENLRSEVALESAAIIRESENRTKLEADKKSREILSLAIQRLASEYTTENTVHAVALPSDDLKGRIIGREGRNIRSFEQITGANLIIDDTPECVTISCFDPVRREIARITMENLIADGRIHPARIEEMFEKATKYVDKQVQEAGEQAGFETGIHDLHPELITTLGKLRYRTSYGQNVLDHSREVAYLAGFMASELGLDPIPAKRAGLLHDIGKAVTHEVDGSHAVIGADLARRFGEKPEIVHAIEAHHNDIEPNSVLDVITQAADAISAARPGARKETLDAYIKRLEKLEEIANSYEGVDRTFAIQAGREVRVMVVPEIVDEAQTTVLAHDIAKRIENEMQYPGQVKVVVIRESRAIGIAK
ncbi:MAG: ribonuclease Y [Coriobacteriia bacterium]|nr:ribonuclease Y [Coriobacteriia bacterium]